ncbi:MAG: histidine phosphatase family protein [Alphaproteobacteria bacterium]|nr:histidine phosphatase family protein [Alphaproteobacteria bacterium]
MAVLYLMRHGEAASAAAGDGDHERALTEAGRQAAAAIARELVERGPAPDLVLCSSARRARETWSVVADEMARLPQVTTEEGLYLAPAPALVERLVLLAPSAAAVLLIGHNPGLYQLALGLAGDGAAEAMATLERGFPAGAVAMLEFVDGDWLGLEDGAGKLLWFATPEDLG